MHPSFRVIVTGALALDLSGIAVAQGVDRNGRCDDAHGRLSPMSVCARPHAACRDAQGHFAKCGTPPAAAKAAKIPDTPKKGVPPKP